MEFAVPKTSKPGQGAPSVDAVWFGELVVKLYLGIFCERILSVAPKQYKQLPVTKKKHTSIHTLPLPHSSNWLSSEQKGPGDHLSHNPADTKQCAPGAENLSRHFTSDVMSSWKVNPWLLPQGTCTYVFIRFQKEIPFVNQKPGDTWWTVNI